MTYQKREVWDLRVNSTGYKYYEFRLTAGVLADAAKAEAIKLGLKPTEYLKFLLALRFCENANTNK